MRVRTLTRTSLLAAGFLATLSAATAAGPDWKAAYGETAGTLRTVGVALYGFYFEELREPVEIEGREGLVISALPEVAAMRVEEWLVPGRLESLPRTDAWGGALEFRVAEAAEGEPYLLVRSRGPDGEWDGDRYTAGGVTPDGEGDDLVWMDGYFLRWPKPAAE